MKLSNKTQASIKIDGKRYDYKRIVKDLCKVQNKAGNYYHDSDTEIVVHPTAVIIRSISGEFAEIPAI